jgi:hypothetical protein
LTLKTYAMLFLCVDLKSSQGVCIVRQVVGVVAESKLTEAGIAGSLNIFGRQPESVSPYYRAATAPKMFGTLLGAKGLQDYLYSPAGQQALLYGLQPDQLRALTSAMQPFATDLGRFAAREYSGE